MEPVLNKEQIENKINRFDRVLASPAFEIEDMTFETRTHYKACSGIYSSCMYCDMCCSYREQCKREKYAK